MLAVIADRYGPPEILQIRDIPKPSPKDNEVLIKVRATTVSSGDCRVRSLTLPPGFGMFGRLALGFSGPRQKILGSELAGDVEAVGKSVTRFKPGDEVFASTGSKLGCHVEYKCIAEDAAIAHKPENLTYEQAAALSFGGNTALHFLKKGNLRAGEKLLVNGASGSVGCAAIQLGKQLGAQVTAVCGTANVELVRSLGADAVIDYTREDFTNSGLVYDVIIDTVGTAPYSRCAASLAKGGRLLVVLGSLGAIASSPFISLFSGKKVIVGDAAARAEYLRFIGELAEAGKFTPIIDRTYPLAQIIDAHRYVDQGHKRGNVVITV